uniref:Uncharacterized protein n=1 Tax=Arundo donax TaxID=35708 RepID=A0A0A8ZDZ2_ARUDO
MALVKKRD